MASSLVYLGFSVIVFIVSFGIMFYIASAVLGSFFSALNQVQITDVKWSAMNTRTQSELQFLVPLMIALGLFILVLKVFMAASTKSAD